MFDKWKLCIPISYVSSSNISFHSTMSSTNTEESVYMSPCTPSQEETAPPWGGSWHGSHQFIYTPSLLHLNNPVFCCSMCQSTSRKPREPTLAWEAGYFWQLDPSHIRFANRVYASIFHCYFPLWVLINLYHRRIVIFVSYILTLQLMPLPQIQYGLRVK